eukprot:m.170039 g.170039  ORF g.170039 m.170039 type:complete len:87 (+) comp17821_c0_seq1:315-575(+)
MVWKHVNLQDVLIAVQPEQEPLQDELYSAPPQEASHKQPPKALAVMQGADPAIIAKFRLNNAVLSTIKRLFAPLKEVRGTSATLNM